MEDRSVNYLSENAEMIDEQYELYVGDIETFAPYDTERAGFWYGGMTRVDPRDPLACSTNPMAFDESLEMYDTESEFLELFLRRIDKKKIKVICFHNSSYDMGFIAEMLRRREGYVQNPKYPVDKMIYGGDKEQVWEIYEELNKPPIIVIDTVPILSGQSLRKLMQSVVTDEEKALLKGETPIVDTWRKPTESDLLYLHHDIAGLARVMNYYNTWKPVLEGRLTNASETQAEFKRQDIDGVVMNNRKGKLRPRYMRKCEPSCPVPACVTKLIYLLVDEVIEKAKANLLVCELVDGKVEDVTYSGGLAKGFKTSVESKARKFVLKKMKEAVGSLLEPLNKEYLRLYREFDKIMEESGVESPFQRKELIMQGYIPMNDKDLCKQYDEVMKLYNEISFSLSVDDVSDFVNKQSKSIEKQNKKYIESTVNQMIRPALRGGMTYLVPKYEDKVIGAGATLDINSMYPSILLECEVPYRFVGCTGRFIKDSFFFRNAKFDYEKAVKKELSEAYVRFTDFVEINRKKHYIVEILRLKAKTKKGCVPCLKRNTNYAPQDRTYEEEIDWKCEIRRGVSNTMLCSVDIDMLFEFYDVEEFVYNRVFYFEADDNYTKRIREHIKYWGHVKETAKNKADRQYAKIMLNSLWGYWCMNDKEVKAKGEKINVGIDDTNLVSGIFTTAYSRYKLACMMNALYDNLVYTDTDSVHILFDGDILGTENVKQVLGDMIDDVTLGKWAYESEFEKARYVKPKTYIHYNEKDMSSGEVQEYAIKSAGADLSKSEITYNGVTDKANLENFRRGATYKTKKALLNEKGQKIICEIDGHI